MASLADLERVAFDGGDYWVQSSGDSYSIQTLSDDTIRFEVQAGDVWSEVDPSTVNRAEIASTVEIPNGTPIHVDYVMNVEPGETNTAEWVVLGQFHQNGANGSPPFAILLSGETMIVNIGFPDANGNPSYRTVFTDSADIQRGHDYSFDIDVKFKPNGDGYLVVKRDGETIVNYKGKLGLDTQTAVYWKEGIYREASDTTMVATYSDLDIVTGNAAAISTEPATAKLDYTTAFAEHKELFEDYGSNVTLLQGSHDDVIAYQSGSDLKVVLKGQNFDLESTTDAGTLESITFKSAQGDIIATIKGLDIDLLDHSDIFTASPSDVEGLVKLALSGNDNVAGTAKGEALYAYGGRDQISAGGGHDEIHGGAGKDHLIGGPGWDQFFFGNSDGKDVIADFDALGGGKAQDYIVLQQSSDVEIINKGSDTLIRYGDGAEILLEGVHKSDVKLGVDIVFDV